MGDKCPNIFFGRKYPSNLLKNKKQKNTHHIRQTLTYAEA